MQRLRAENETLRQEKEHLPDLETVRARILSGLKLGKQAPGYKAAVKALDCFIAELRLQ